MAGPSEDEKDAASKDATFFDRFANAAGGTALTMTAAEAVSSHGSSEPFAIASIAVIGILGVTAIDRKIVCKRIADDPPRLDYTLRTMPQPLGLNLKLLAATHRVGAIAAAAISDQWRSNLLLNARLRAYERSQGADRARDDFASEARLSEAEHWGGEAAERLLQAARNLITVADELDREESGRLLAGADQHLSLAPRKASFEQLLPLSVLGLVYRTGLPINRLRREVEAEPILGSPLRAFSVELRGAAEQNMAFAHALVGQMRD